MQLDLHFYASHLDGRHCLSQFPSPGDSYANVGHEDREDSYATIWRMNLSSLRGVGEEKAGAEKNRLLRHIGREDRE